MLGTKAGSLGQLRQSEIQDFNVAVGSHHYVFGLDVSMHDVGSVRRRKGRSNLSRDIDLLNRIELLAFQEPSQGFTVNEFSSDELAAVHVSDLMNGKNVWMIQR